MLAFNDKMAGIYTTPDDVLLSSAHAAALPFGQGVTSGFLHYTSIRIPVVSVGADMMTDALMGQNPARNRGKGFLISNMFGKNIKNPKNASGSLVPDAGIAVKPVI